MARRNLRQRLVDASLAGRYEAYLGVGLGLAVLGLILFALALRGPNAARAWQLFHVNWVYFTGLCAGSIAFADALDFDFVGLDRSSSLQRFLSDKAERTGRRLKLRVQLRSFDAVCRLVECNVGIGVVPETTVERNQKTIQLRRIDLTDDWAIRRLTICVRKLQDLPTYAQELVRHLTASSEQRAASNGS